MGSLYPNTSFQASMVTHTGARSNTKLSHQLHPLCVIRFTNRIAVTYLVADFCILRAVGVDLRLTVVSMDEKDGQKQGSAFYTVNYHVKK